MKKLVCTVLPLLAIALVLATGTAMAQDNVYSLSYFANAHTTGAPDAILRLANDGNVSDSAPNGNLWADIYVFAPDEQMAECCSCGITPNGYLALSVNNALAANPLTGVPLHRGLVKVLSTNNSNPATPSLRVGIRGWMTHIQNNLTSFSITEAQLTDSTLGEAEYADLGEDCGVLIELGSGHGICRCADSGH